MFYRMIIPFLKGINYMKREMESFLRENFGKQKRAEKVFDQLSFTLDENLNNCELARSDRMVLEMALHIISEAIIETSEILKTDVPFVGFFIPNGDTKDNPARGFSHNNTETDAVLTGHNHDNSLKININLFYFLEQGFLMSDPFYRTEGEQELNKMVAHEMYHVYVAHKYPKTDYNTRLANEMRGDAYLRDRGEIAADLFAKRYAELKLREEKLLEAA